MSDLQKPASLGKRLALGVAWVLAGIFALCVALWLYGTLTFAPRLQQRLASLQQRGEPITLTEAMPAPIPPPRNAAPLYLSVFQVEFAPGSHNQTSGFAGLNNADLDELEAFRKGLSGEGVAGARELLGRASVRAALTTLRAATQKPVAVFPVKWDEGFTALFPHLAKFRAAERLVMAQALVSAADGRREEAADWLWVGLRFPRHTLQEPTLIAQLVTYAMVAMVADTMPRVLAYGELSAPTSQRLRAELTSLELNGALKQALLTERVSALSLFQQAERDPNKFANAMGVGTGAPLAPTLAFLSRTLFARPFWQLQQLMYLDHMDRTMPIVLADYRSAPKLAQARMRPWDMSSMLLPMMGRLGRTRDQTLARIGLMRVALALNDYHAAHRLYPTALAELGAVVPQDPFSGKSFLYARDGASYLLYSLGANLKDDGGTVAEKRSERAETGDLVWGK